MLLSKEDISQVVKILRRSVKHLKDPAVTLVGKRWRDPFLVLISCVLSLRTKDGVTLSASERLFNLARDPQRIRKLSTEKIARTIYPVGFYKTKAKNIQAMCQDIIERFGGQVPDEIDALLTLPGVGRKTANLVVTEGFGKLGVCVDTHVHRISNRLGYVRTKTPEATEWALRQKLPERFWKEFNALLVVWGQNVCKPISPFCSRCPVRGICQRRGVTTRR